MELTPSIILSGISASVTAGVAIFAWQRRDQPGMLALAAVNVGIAIWTGGNCFQIAASTLDGKLLWVNVQYVGIALIPPSVFAFAAGFANQKQLVTRRRMALLAAPMVVVVLLSWTNELHGLIRTSEALTTVGGTVVLDRTFGPAFWIGWAYSTLLNLAATALLVQAVLYGGNLYRRQVAALIVGAFVPWVAQLLFFAGINPIEPESFFVVTGVAFVYAVSRYRFLDLFPVARETIIETLDDGILVLDDAGRIVDLNVTARTILGTNAVVGATPETAFETVPELLAAYRDNGSSGLDDGETIILTDEEYERRFDVRISHLRGSEHRVVVLRDVTSLADRERELERKNRRLEEFTALLSHDLRGPLSIASGYVDLERDERDSERLERAAEGLRRMDEIIDGLLALAREDQPAEATKRIELATLARTAWGHVETGEARLVVDSDQTIDVEFERLLRALENLFRNAIEHGNADELRIGDLDNGFYVADNGSGFDADPDAVFEWGFSTADGTGLGLAIVRRIAEAHDWNVRATDSADGGARFEVTGVERQSAVAAPEK